MKKRGTQWLKGFELLNLRREGIGTEIEYLEKYFQRKLPHSLFEYITKYKPIDIYDYSNYEDEVYFYEPGILVVNTPDKSWGNHYPIQFICDVNNIIRSLDTDENSSLGCLQRTLNIIPIASNGSPDGSIVYSLEKRTLGKIYTLVDYQISEINEDNLIANDIQRFISNLEVIPEKVL